MGIQHKKAPFWDNLEKFSKTVKTDAANSKSSSDKSGDINPQEITVPKKQIAMETDILPREMDNFYILFNPKGRINRALYLRWTIGILMPLFLLFFVIDWAFGLRSYLIVLSSLLLLYPIYNINAKRMHDMGFKPLAQLVVMLPVALIMLSIRKQLLHIFSVTGLTAIPPFHGKSLVADLFVFFAFVLIFTLFGIKKGERGDSKFGPDPFGSSDHEAKHANLVVENNSMIAPPTPALAVEQTITTSQLLEK